MEQGASYKIMLAVRMYFSAWAIEFTRYISDFDSAELMQVRDAIYSDDRYANCCFKAPVSF